MKILYPEVLPISSHRDELVEGIRNNDVTIIVGETGSGKSTQIPKLIAEALDARKLKALIACTQPRRIAAVAIATRVAEECEVELGTEIGYKIRFDDQTYPGTKIIVCTDGILLQEIKFDVTLSKYDAVFVDEAHERSLRIDFLLGLLKDIQRKRRADGMKPLKIIVASATLDSEKFIEFFAKEKDLKVAHYQVSGRMFPVDVIYKSLEYDEYHDEPTDLFLEIAKIVDGIHTEGKPGDILIFLPGEQEISFTINAIKELGHRELKCLPLFSRLPMEEQVKIFAEHKGIRHVVVSTNIAETSLTVPGVTVVIDSGLARMTDFDTRTGIGSLKVEEVSQASAIQRTGRAGRIEPGKCFRLYSERNFKEREFYTRPEIQRSDLADVVLQMMLMGIPDIHRFEFMDPPSYDAFEQAIQTLKILGALDFHEKLTGTGFKMAHLPLDPKISRMLIAAETFDCLPQVAVIASFLSLKDPFVRPFGDEERADKARAFYQRMAMPKLDGGKVYYSDLLTFLAVWKKVFSLATDEERSQYCSSYYLDFQTLEKAREIYLQLVDTLVTFYGEEFKPYEEKLLSMLVAENLGASLEDTGDMRNTGILKAIVSGLIQNLCQRNRYGNYSSNKVDRIHIHPSSLFYNRHPQWMVATEIVETTKRFARNITEVNPEWFENLRAGRRGSGKRGGSGGANGGGRKQKQQVRKRKLALKKSFRKGGKGKRFR